MYRNEKYNNYWRPAYCVCIYNICESLDNCLLISEFLQMIRSGLYRLRFDGIIADALRYMNLFT